MASPMMNLALAACVSAAILGLVGCSSEKKAEAPAKAEPAAVETARTPKSTMSGSSVTAVREGVPGGVLVDTFSATATVTMLDKANRMVTLTSEDGTQATFTAGPEIRNFDQLNIGDKVTATLTDRLEIYVRQGGSNGTVTSASAAARTPKGARPGVIIASAVEVVATVKSINTATRDVVLAFPDGEVRTVNARPDVELSKYKSGDSVVFVLSQSLSLVASGS